MSEGDARLEQVQERIDEAHEAADRAGRDLLPQDASPADPTGSTDEQRDQGTFEPAGDDADAGRNPTEGEDADTPGAADEADASR